MRRGLIKVGAFAVILDEQRQVLLCHRCDVDLWNLPGGGVERGETPWQAVVREVKEEVGLEVKVSKLAGIYLNPARALIAFSFVCKIIGGKLTTSNEADDIEYFAFEQMPRYTSPHQVARIRDILDKPNRLHLKLQHGPSAKKLRKKGKL
ncbi:MAG: hypothetical protein NVS4B7_04380 [Ktedonobacteraceae bacterium]